MSQDNDRNESRMQSLHAVLAEYIRRQDAGEAVDIESFCAAYPELADGLRSYAEGEGMLEALSDPAGVAPDNLRSAETLRPGAAQRTDFASQAEFGRYRLIRQLGNGAMGAVYLAEDTQLGRRVALKIPTCNGTEGPEFLKRFKREAQAAAQLEHQNLCRIYDFGDVNGTPFISMEYIDGPPLAACVGVAAYRDQRRIAEIIVGIATGLQCAHERGILHRDVKSSNVLMKNGESPCVSDFGLALIDGHQESKLTHEGSILGTPAYMAPEQIQSDRGRIGPHSDVYALGVVLYEMLAGHTPFQGGPLVMLNQALNDRPQPLQKVRADVDPKLADYCLRMLEKDPERRPKSMQEVIDYLDRWLQQTSPDSLTQQAKSEQERSRYEAMKSKVLGLVQRGQHPQAIAALEKMQKLTGTVGEEYAEWARTKIPDVKKLPQQLRKAVPDLVNTSRKCIRKYDYAQAALLLQDIPPDFRTPEAQQTLDKALELQEESDLLLLALKDCVRTRDLNGIEENLKRFLALKPGNRFAKELWESLQTYSKLPYNQRNYKFDKKGNLQPRVSGSFWDNWLLVGTLCFAFVFGVAYSGIMIYLKDGSRTLAVEVNDDWLREQGGSISLDVDGKEHLITAGDTQVKVTFGEHGFSVRQGSTVVHNPQTFSIEKGDTRILHIDANGMHLSAAGNPPPPSSRSIGLKSIYNKVIPGHDVRNGLAFGPGGNHLFVSYANADQEQHRLMRISFLNEAEAIEFPFTPSDIDTSPNSGIVALARHAGMIQLANASDLSITKQLQCSDQSGQFVAVRFSPNGRYLAGITYFNLVAIWEVESSRKVAEFVVEADDKWFGDIAFSPDSNVLFASGVGPSRRIVYQYDLVKQESSRHEILALDGPGTLEALSSNQLLLGSWNKGFAVIDINKGKMEKKFGVSGHGTRLAISSDQRFIATSNENNLDVAIYDTQSLTQIADVNFEHTKLTALQFSGDGQYLAALGELKSGGVDNVVLQVWKLQGVSTSSNDESSKTAAPRTPLPDGPPGLVTTLKGHTDNVLAIATTPDGRKLISSGKDRVTKVWDIETGNVSHTLPLPAFVYQLQVEGKDVLMGGVIGRLGRYGISDGELKLSYRGYPDDSEGGRSVMSLLPGRESGQFVTCARRGAVAVWSMDQKNPITEFETDEAYDYVDHVTPGFLLSGHRSKDVRIVDRQGKELRSISQGFNGPAVVAPDGNFILRQKDNGIVEVDITTSSEGRKYNTTYMHWGHFSQNGKFILCQDGNYNLQIWNRSNGDNIYRAKLPCLAVVQRFSPDGRFLYLSGEQAWTQRPDTNDIYVWRLPEEVTASGGASSGSTDQSRLTGFNIVSGTKLTGTYIQQTPVATHDIVVTLNDQRGGVWHGEFESLRAHHPAGSEIKTGFKYSCELTVTSPSTASLRMTKIIGNTSGNTIRDTTANWVEELQWDGKSLTNQATKLTPDAATPGSSGDDATRPATSSKEVLRADRWSIAPKSAERDWQRDDGTLAAKKGSNVSVAWTSVPYNDFLLSFEYQCGKDANGGVVLRSPKPHDFSEPVFEVHLGDGRDNRFKNNSYNANLPSTGGLFLTNSKKDYTEIPADFDAYRPGTWNQCEITLSGRQLTVSINYRCVLNRSLDELSTEQPDFADVLKPDVGLIGLQCWAGTISYRNLTLTTSPKIPTPRRWNAPDAKTDTSVIVRGQDPFADRNIPAGARWVDKQGIAFRWCPPGAYGAGDPPQSVRLTKGFWLAETELTQHHWREVMRTNPWEPHPNTPKGSDYPACGMTYGEAQEFAKQKNAPRYSSLPQDCIYVLPSEAMWEYACRAGTSTTWYFGDNKSALSDHCWSGGRGPHEVAKKKSNPWGFFDMYGNVGEMVLDTYRKERTYGTDPLYKGGMGAGMIFRGESWWHAPDNSTSRPQRNPYKGNGDEGIRLAIVTSRGP